MTTTSIAGKKVLITGGARGIGLATAQKLAARGARISLVGLEPDLLERNAKALGEGHTSAPADVTDQASMDAAVTTTVEALGGIDVVVANAGIATLGTVRTVDPDAFARTIDINLTGVYRTIYPAVPHLVQSKGYALVVASVASIVPLPGGASYSASKAGAEYLAACLRTELAQYGVGVGSIHPSWIDTDLVRDAELQSPTFAAMRKGLPWPANVTSSVEVCAEAMVHAIETRARKSHIPANTKVFAALRPLLLGGVAQRFSTRKVSKDLVSIDRENQARGATWH